MEQNTGLVLDMPGNKLPQSASQGAAHGKKSRVH